MVFFQRCSFYEENNFLAVRRNTEDITESLRANAGRRRRVAANDDFSDTFVEETSSEGEFHPLNFKDYKEIEILSWPTASGLTESEVYDYCRGVIFRSSGAQECQSVKARKKVGNDSALIDNCAKDIQVRNMWECRDVGSSIVTSLGYVHKFLQTRIALYYV